jgi:hypothetical protein
VQPYEGGILKISFVKVKKINIGVKYDSPKGSSLVVADEKFIPKFMSSLHHPTQQTVLGPFPCRQMSFSI